MKAVARLLLGNELLGYKLRKPLLIQKRHLQDRLKYTKREKKGTYLKVKSDETKLEVFDYRAVAYVWRKMAHTKG